MVKNSLAEEGHLKADLLMVLVTMLAAVGWVFSIQALKGLPPMLFMGVRFLIAGLLLVGLSVHSVFGLGLRHLLKAGAIGLVMGVTMLSWIVGLHQAGSVGAGAFICSLGMILAPLAGWLLFGMSVTRRTWVCAMVAIVGMGFLSLENGLNIRPSDIYFFITACGLAVHFNLNARFVASIPVVTLTAIQLMVVGVLCLLASTGFEQWPTAIDGGVVGWLLASILIATSLRFFLQLKAQSLASVSHASLIMTLEPVWTAWIAAIWLGERMSGVQLAGCALILLALFASRWRRLPARPRDQVAAG